MQSRDLSDPPRPKPVMMAVTPYPEDARFLESICGPVCGGLRTSGTVADALSQPEIDNAPVVLCERDLPDGNWKDVLIRLRNRSTPVRLIVTSLHADEWLWAEVLNLGGYDVLAKPFDRKEAQRVLSLALRTPSMQVA